MPVTVTRYLFTDPPAWNQVRVHLRRLSERHGQRPIAIEVSPGGMAALMASLDAPSIRLSAVDGIPVRQVAELEDSWCMVFSRSTLSIARSLQAGRAARAEFEAAMTSAWSEAFEAGLASLALPPDASMDDHPRLPFPERPKPLDLPALAPPEPKADRLEMAAAAEVARLNAPRPARLGALDQLETIDMMLPPADRLIGWGGQIRLAPPATYPAAFAVPEPLTALESDLVARAAGTSAQASERLGALCTTTAARATEIAGGAADIDWSSDLDMAALALLRYDAAEAVRCG